MNLFLDYLNVKGVKYRFKKMVDNLNIPIFSLNNYNYCYGVWFIYKCFILIEIY